jgi:DNA-directed RNA polymerase specialized sigma24 family protein
MKYDPEALTRHVLACADQGMSQIEAAELLRVSPSTIHRICSGGEHKARKEKT